MLSQFQLRNVAIGTMLTKVDILLTAVIGAILISESLSTIGVMALLELAGVAWTVAGMLMFRMIA